MKFPAQELKLHRSATINSKYERDMLFLLRKLFDKLFCFMFILFLQNFNFLSGKPWCVINYTHGTLTTMIVDDVDKQVAIQEK